MGSYIPQLETETEVWTEGGMTEMIIHNDATSLADRSHYLSRGQRCRELTHSFHEQEFNSLRVNPLSHLVRRRPPVGPRLTELQRCLPTPT